MNCFGTKNHSTYERWIILCTEYAGIPYIGIQSIYWRRYQAVLRFEVRNSMYNIRSITFAVVHTL